MSGAILADIACAAIGLGLGVWGGFRLAERYGSPVWRFWLLVGGALLVCSSICALALTFGARWLAVASLGVLAGAFTGLKYGVRGGFVMHPGAPPKAVDVDEGQIAVDAEMEPEVEPAVESELEPELELELEF